MSAKKDKIVEMSAQSAYKKFTKKNSNRVTSLFVSRWSPTLVLEKALSCLTSLIGREAVEPGWYERY